MKTPCHKVDPDLSAYIDGELPEVRRAEVAAHLAGCPRCRKLAGQMQELSAGVAQLPQVEPAPGFLSDVRAKLRGAQERSVAGVLFRPFWVKVPLEALALVAVLLTATVLVRPPLSRDPSMAREKHAASAEPAGAVASPVQRVAADKPAAIEDAQAERTLPAAGPVSANGPAPSASVVTAPMAPATPAPAARGGGADRLEYGAVVKSPVAQSPPSVSGKNDRTEIKSSADGLDVAAVARNGAANEDGRRSVETVVVTAADAAAVQRQAEAVAVGLGGKVTGLQASRAGAAAAGQSFRVELPTNQVVAFKSQFAASPQQAELARLKGGVAGSVVAEQKLRTQGMATAGGVGGVLKEEAQGVGLGGRQEAAPTAVLEIQVVPPGQ